MSFNRALLACVTGYAGYAAYAAYQCFFKEAPSVPFRIEELPGELKDKVIKNLPLSGLAALGCASKRFKKLCVESMVPAAITEISKDEAQYAASSLSELARKSVVNQDSIKARHDALVDHFKGLSVGDEDKERFSGGEIQMIGELSLSPNTTPSQYAGQLEQLAQLETKYNYRVLAHEIGTQGGQEAGVSYDDVLKEHSVEGLKELIEGFPNKGQVQRLNLGNQGLTALPAGVFARLGNLDMLDLYNNKLKALPEGVFAGLNALRELFLYNNKLTKLPAGVFSGLNVLRWLELANNELTELTEDVFSGLGRLEGLPLHHNQLTELPVGVFSGLNALQWLLLHHNQLTGLTEDVFSGLGHLEDLPLHHNKLTEGDRQVLHAFDAAHPNCTVRF